MTIEQVLQLAVSLLAVLALYGLARGMKLGGDVRIRDEDHARLLANDAIDGFDAVDIVLDRAGIGALLKDADGRQMVLRRNGAHFVGRLLEPDMMARLDQQFLSLDTNEPGSKPVILNLGEAAQHWAAGFRHLRHG